MDKTSVAGLLLGFFAIGAGIMMEGITTDSLINGTALLIILAGTAAAVIIAFPSKTIRNVPLYFKVLFTNHHEVDIGELIDDLTQWAEKSRREGLLSLEGELEELEDPFLVSGIQLAVDGQNPDFIREVLLEKINAMEERHEEGARVFSQAGTYAPTLGVLGAVVGLIAALGNLEDMEVLGAAISSAFIATLLGIFTGYVLWHPFANKLKEKSNHEVMIKEIMVEGILSITAGESPSVIRDKLSSYLSPREIEKIEKNKQKLEEQEGSHAQTEKG